MIANEQPLVSFLIGGVQKSGTTALAECLRLHPDVCLPRGKETHVFDDPAFDDAWDVTQVNAALRPHYDEPLVAVQVGDATPVYSFFEHCMARIARYNPGMRWVILLRDPVERAISHYYMERERGRERWPLWAALLFERWRLRGHHHERQLGSILRNHSYRLRGDYARLLDALYRHFSREQVLLAYSAELRHDPRAVLARVYAHLGLAGPVRLPGNARGFAGGYARLGRASPTLWLARLLLWPEKRRMGKRYGIDFEGRPGGNGG